MKEFRCPFKKCKYKTDSYLILQQHLEYMHKLRSGVKEKYKVGK